MKREIKNLSHKDINKFRFEGKPGGRDIAWDKKITGLGLRIYESGKKSFVLSYRFGGRKHLMALGPYGVWTVDQARTEAGKKLIALKDGIDPIEEKLRAGVGNTFSDLSKHYIESHAKPNKKTWKEDKRRLDNHTPASWKQRLAANITRNDVSGLYGNLKKDKPYEANRVLALLRHMFRLGQEWGHIPEGTPNPAILSKEVKFKEQKRKRYLKEHELPALAKAIDAEENIYVRSALWLYLLTGLRKTELLTAKRENINWEDKLLRLPDTKADEEQFATLSAPAIAIMQATPKMEKNPYLLPGRRKGKHLVNITIPWRRVRKAAKCEDLRLHDLRRTVGSWMTQSGVDLNTIKEALRHADVATTLTYARLGQDAAREPMEALGKQIMEVAGKNRPKAVKK